VAFVASHHLSPIGPAEKRMAVAKKGPGSLSYNSLFKITINSCVP